MAKVTHRDKGAGSLSQRADGMWIASVELPPGPHGKRRRKKIARKNYADAVAALRALRRDLDKAGDLTTSSPTVTAWMTDWLDRIAAKRLKPRTLSTYAGYSTRYIVPTIGNVRLEKLGPAHVAKVHAYITDPAPSGCGLSSTTALQAHAVLRKALGDAMREGVVGRNVASDDYIDAPRRAVNTREALTADQARTLLLSVAADPGLATAWTVAFLTGMRQGERLGITRDMVDLDAGTITVAWQLQRLRWSHDCGKPKAMVGWPCGRKQAGACPERVMPIPAGQEAREVYGGLWLTRPKSRAGWRTVPLAPELHAVLTAYLRDVEPGDEGLIFHRPDGHPIDPSHDSAAWTASLAAAGLPPVVLHSARHTANTLLHELGVDSETRQKIMGHSSAVVNASYVHVADPLMRDAMKRLGERLTLTSA